MSSRFGTSTSPRVRTVQLSTLEHSIVNAQASSKRTSQSTIADAKFGLQKVLAITLAVVTAVFYPASAYVYAEGSVTSLADTTTTNQSEPAPAATESAPPPPPETTAPAPTTTPLSEPKVTEPMYIKPAYSPGPTSPTGAESSSYVYNSATELWENDYYTWDPVTKKTSPKTPQDYSYNPVTKHWDTIEYRYDAPTGKYVPNTVSSATNPNAPAPVAEADSFFDLYYNADISNIVVSQATSGDALISFNTTGGSALTGDALVLATLLSMVNSSTNYNGGQVATFSSDIYGDVYGDLYVDPAMLATLQPSTTPDSSNVTVKVQGEGSIENNVAIGAQSGDATVQSNTTADSATSGDATAVLNLVNVLNSIISSNGSFIGMLNIFGNLNGDILLPLGLLNTLLASNVSGGGDLDANLSDDQSITNLVNTAAASGNATVDGNTTAGAAATGNSSTNITLLNLTGRQVVGSNSLLVFVNVLGKWVGVIMDAPAGSTSAALGTGVTQNDCSSCTGDTEVDADTSSAIHNNVDVRAASGDATVTHNTTAGDATSGDANAAVNILNISNSSFSFADWFGVLFINVFGTWNGSFGVDTAAGEPSAAPKQPAPKTAKTKAAQVFRFVAGGDGKQHVERADLDGATYDAAVKKAVKAAEDSKHEDSGDEQQTEVEQAAAPANTTMTSGGKDLLFPALGFTIGGTLLGAERAMQHRNRRKINL